MRDFYLSHEELKQVANGYALHFPEEARQSLAIANHAVENEFIVPYTNDLTRWIPMGHPVNWLYNPTNDLEFTWGMNRHWHMLDLGKAYLMNGDSKYVAAFIEHFRGWRKQNPLPVSSSYEEAVFFQKPGPWRLLETGLRVQSWISAYKYMEDSPLLDNTFQMEFLDGLEEHAEYLTRYLGSTEINHAIMHMQGLILIATFYHWHERAPYWRQLAMERLELCMHHQLNPEGVQVELTTHYHNASIEMFGTPYMLGRLSGHPFSDWYGDSLSKMAAFTEALIRPDHQSTGIGDSDWVGDGRQRLTLLGSILGDDDIIRRGAADPQCLWLLGVEEYERCLALQADNKPSLHSRSFPETGYYVMRDAQQYLFFDAAAMGGAHGHADALNLEWMWQNQLLFTDTGRYTYEEGEWRHYFKSTRAHNTITVDGKDQTEYVSTQQWGEPAAETVTHRWESNEKYHFIDASHDGYARLNDPVKHRRWVLSGVSVPLMLIVDWLQAEGQHTLEQRFHFHPQAEAELQAEQGSLQSARLTFPEPSVSLTMQWQTAGLHAGSEFAIRKEGGWVSEIYGSKTQTPVIQGQAIFSGNACILTICMPEDVRADPESLRVTSCTLDPERMFVEVSYTWDNTAGTILLDCDSLQWMADVLMEH